MNETPQGTWLVGGKTDSLWFCSARPSAGKQKNDVSGNWRRPISDSLGEEE